MLYINSSKVVGGRRGKRRNLDILLRNSSILYANVSAEVPTKHSLYSESDGESGSIWDQLLSAPNLDANGEHAQEFAMLRARPGQYFSAKATISVHSVNNTGMDQQSVAAVWVTNLADGPPQKSNILTAGCHVHPRLYGDNVTRFFVAWMIYEEGRLQRGCINLKCEGFVLQSNPIYTPGRHIDPPPKYMGPQNYVTVRITKDSTTGDWWVYGGANTPIGYWPKTLFTSLAVSSATNVDFGGAVAFGGGEKGPPMGSGVFPSASEGKGAELVNLDVNNMSIDPHDKTLYYIHQSKPDWYRMVYGLDRMFFGGPGGYGSG